MDKRAETYKDIAEYREGEQLIRLIDDPAGVLAWAVFSSGAVCTISWRDVSNNHHSLLTDDGQGKLVVLRDYEEYLWTAAEKALYVGGWLHAIYLDNKLLPADCAFVSKSRFRRKESRQIDVLPIGGATSLLSVNALADVFHVSTRSIENWISYMEIPKLRVPGDRVFLSLWTVELCILKKLLPGLSWVELAEQLKTAQTIYGAARKSATIERLRKLAVTLKPNSRLLQRAARTHRHLKGAKKRVLN